MTLDERRKLLIEIQKGKPCATGYQLFFQDGMKPFEVWNIPIEYLVYNQYNGRIGSAVKSYEKQYKTLNPEINQDIKVIEDFLYKSNKPANKNTESSLRRRGQEKFGIVTADGIIIDGNRRASLMRKIVNDHASTPEEKQRCSYFKAVILPLNASKVDVIRLETSFQMGEDAKVDYEPIEKYLKCGDLKNAGFTVDDIATAMGVKVPVVREYLSVLELMDVYLMSYGYDGIYTLASGHEDSFLKLDDAISAYKQGVGLMWDISKADISDLKGVAFDYIRFGLKQNDIREIIQKPTSTKPNSSIFSQKSLWSEFYSQHVKNLPEEIPVDEYLQKHEGENINTVLEVRDREWKKIVGKNFETNFSAFQDILRNKQQANEPLRLVSKAISALESIDTSTSAFKHNFEAISKNLDKLIEITNNLKQIK